jgi:hypothetical protein
MHPRTDLVQDSNRKMATKKLKINYLYSKIKPGPTHKFKTVNRDMNWD